MANPLPNEEEIYQKIEQENLSVHPLIWNLINHHIRNDLQAISMAAASFYSMPEWILKFASWAIRFLYRMSRTPGDPDDLFSLGRDVEKRIKNIDNFLRKLEGATLK